MSFAAAVSRAGAKQVVAALWVPAFYATLAADPEHNAATALRAAQQRLREPRVCHPFFWAGMQATARLSLAVPAATLTPIAALSQKSKPH